MVVPGLLRIIKTTSVIWEGNLSCTKLLDVLGISAIL